MSPYMNSLRWCCPRVPVPDPEIGLRLGNDPGGASDVEAPRCEKLLAGFRLRGMRPEASRDRRRTPRGLACQGRVRVGHFTELGGAAGPWLGRLGRRTCASGGSLLSTRCREGGALRVFGGRRVRAVGKLASPARLDEWATRPLGHLLVADVLGRLLAGRRTLHKLLAELLREVVVRGAADELLRLLPLTRGPFLFAEVVPKQRFLVGHVGRRGGDPDARAQGGLFRPPGLRLRRGLAGCGLLGVALGGRGGGLLAHLLGGGLALLGHESLQE